MTHEQYEIIPVARPICGTVRPPGSKSITNRALILAALAQGQSELTGVLDSVDTRVMINCLKQLGFELDVHLERGAVTVQGGGGAVPVAHAELWCENSGTSIRFLTALCAVGPAGSPGRYRLDGNSRMRERPIQPLVDALVQAGVNARCEHGNGSPPVVIETGGPRPGRIPVSGDLSSQYLSALLMILPGRVGGPVVEVVGELVSRPYVDMTLAMIAAFGGNVREHPPNQFVAEASISGVPYEVEPDASAASYFFAAAAVTGGEVTVEGLTRNSLQGDVHFVDALVEMGCRATWRENSITLAGGPLRGIDIDMNAISDTAQTLACVAPFAAGPTRIRNVAHMRHKETDRVAAVVAELRRAGLVVEEHPDGMTIYPGSIQPTVIQTYDDHRMAMSFSLLGLRVPGIRIADPGCTSKTYPNYFADLETLCRMS